MTTRTLTCNASEIKRPMAGARAIMRTKFGHQGTCRLRWNANFGRAEVVATDFLRIGRMRFRATTLADDLDLTMPFEAVRAIANWRSSRVTIEETPEGLTISTGEPNARRQRFQCERRYDGESIDRVLALDDTEDGPSVKVNRTKAQRALYRTGDHGGDASCLLTVDGDGVNAWDVRKDAKWGDRPRAQLALAAEPAAGHKRIATLVRRKHLRDALRSISGSAARLTFGKDHKFLRLRSSSGNDEFVLETKKPAAATKRAA